MNVRTITAKLGSKEYTLNVKLENEFNFSGNATGSVSYIKGGKIVREAFWIDSDGANQTIDWAKGCKLTEKQTNHFEELIALMYHIQNSENLLESVKVDLVEDYMTLSPEDTEELIECKNQLMESIKEDRTELFTLRNI